MPCKTIFKKSKKNKENSFTERNTAKLKSERNFKIYNFSNKSDLHGMVIETLQSSAFERRESKTQFKKNELGKCNGDGYSHLLSSAKHQLKL